MKKEFDMPSKTMDQKILEEGKRIAETAREKGIELRLMGAIAIKLHCPKYIGVHEAMGRELSDIDFMSLGKYRNKIKVYLKELGYVPRWFDEMPSIEDLRKKGANTRVLVMERASLYRQIYDHPETGIIVDVFFDKLEMCHTIEFRKRLTVDCPTLALADLILCKMQIIQLTEKDVKDMLVLLLEHEVGDTDDKMINAKYISKLLSRDWGFYYTFTTNLKKIQNNFISLHADKLEEEGVSTVKSRISQILDAVEKAPKSLGWKLRSKIGTKRIWYREVA